MSAVLIFNMRFSFKNWNSCLRYLEFMGFLFFKKLIRRNHYSFLFYSVFCTCGGLRCNICKIHPWHYLLFFTFFFNFCSKPTDCGGFFNETNTLRIKLYKLKNQIIYEFKHTLKYVSGKKSDWTFKTFVYLKRESCSV